MFFYGLRYGLGWAYGVVFSMFMVWDGLMVSCLVCLLWFRMGLWCSV